MNGHTSGLRPQAQIKSTTTLPDSIIHSGCENLRQLHTSENGTKRFQTTDTRSNIRPCSSFSSIKYSARLVKWMLLFEVDRQQ